MTAGAALAAAPAFTRAALVTAPALARAPVMRVVLLGQSLVQQDICTLGWPSLPDIQARFAGADVVFTDLETAIAVPGNGTPMRSGEVLHAAAPNVLDCLKIAGVTMVTTANNHAWDMGSGGILAAIDALDVRGIAHAGSGADLARASAAGVQATPHGAFALVSAAAGAIRDGAAATVTRPGVAELRRLASGELDPGDVARTLAAIRAARAGGATVLFCLHNHYWEAEQSVTPAWQRRLARAAIDAGAAAFVGHGVPLMQGSETYRGAPLYHGLGNFIFQTRKPDAAYGAATWRSMIVDARFRDGRFLGATLIPVVLEADKAGGEFSRGYPVIAR
jgi:poly-gamma-glutamate capsule biosynthesis protein CapA/YwtB (metallophosphatase superfamily)